MQRSSEPGVQLLVAPDPHPRREEPLPHRADLVLDLALLPARRRRAGHRLDQVVPAHLLEAPVVVPGLADQDRVHRRLHVVVDAPRAGALEEGEGPVVGVEHHLLALARIGPHEQHPAVAEPDLRHLHRHRDPGDQHHLVAPVELVGLARREAQRHERRRRRRGPLALPAGRIPPHRVVAAVVAEPAQLLEDPDQRQPLPARPRRIHRQQPVELLPPRPDLRLRLHACARTRTPSPRCEPPGARSSARPSAPGRSP